jgi:hypothetical protein
VYQQEPSAAAGLLVLLPWLVVIGCAIGVYIDARAIGARKGLVPGFLNLGPVGWSLCTLLFWILCFPLYLVQRGKIRKAATERATPRQYGQSHRPIGWAEAAQQAQGWAQQSPSVLPPANWYEDPEHHGYNRWWDGHRWTEHRTPKPY